MNMNRIFLVHTPGASHKIFFLFKPLFLDMGYLHFSRARFLYKKNRDTPIMIAFLKSRIDEIDNSDSLNNYVEIGEDLVIDNTAKATLLLQGFMRIPDLSNISKDLFDFDDNTEFVDENVFYEQRDNDPWRWIDKYSTPESVDDDFFAHLKQVYL
jgi:hypothetical protein